MFSATIAATTDPAAAMPPRHAKTDVPAAAIAYLAALDEPMLFTGNVVVGAELLRRVGR